MRRAPSHPRTSRRRRRTRSRRSPSGCQASRPSQVNSWCSPPKARAVAESSSRPIENLIVNWPAAFGEGEWYAFNKIALISLIAMIVPVLFFLLRRSQGLSRARASCRTPPRSPSTSSRSRSSSRPSARRACATCRCSPSCSSSSGSATCSRSSPPSHMPANARMANPLMLAMVAWVMFIGVGVKHNGLGYFKDALFPPGRAQGALPPGDPDRVALDLHHPPLLARRASLRQHARRPHPAGDLQGADASPSGRPARWRSCWCLSFAMLVAFTGFEFMVAFLQAFIFAC